MLLTLAALCAARSASVSLPKLIGVLRPQLSLEIIHRVLRQRGIINSSPTPALPGHSTALARTRILGQGTRTGSRAKEAVAKAGHEFLSVPPKPRSSLLLGPMTRSPNRLGNSRCEQRAALALGKACRSSTPILSSWLVLTGENLAFRSSRSPFIIGASNRQSHNCSATQAMAGH